VEVLKLPTLGIPVFVEPTLMCRALIGLVDGEVVGVFAWTVPMQVHVASTTRARRVRRAAPRRGSSGSSEVHGAAGS
jgi:hypothetical protein